MSNAATGIAWAHTTATTQTQKLILMKIADMDGDGGAWPSMKTLAAAAMVTIDAARRTVRQLEELGEVKTHLNEGGGIRSQKHMRTNVYEFLLVCPWYCDGSSAHKDLRDENNSRLRPAYWPEMVAANTGQTPLPQDRDPSPGSGGPLPQDRPNHNLTTPIDQDNSSNLTLLDASEKENTPEAQADQFENWHPGAQVARAHAQVAAAKPVKRPDYSKPEHPARFVAPAPVVPRYQAEPQRRTRDALSAYDAGRQAIARTLPCPRGTADATHTMPGLSLMCTRCGIEAEELAL